MACFSGSSSFFPARKAVVASFLPGPTYSKSDQLQHSPERMAVFRGLSLLKSVSLHLVRLPQGAALTVGSRIFSCSLPQGAHNEGPLHCSLGDKDIWLRIADPSSKRRALSHACGSQRYQSCCVPWPNCISLAFISALHPMCRLSLRLRTWCDNSGAESASNKMFTTSWPFAAFFLRLALLSSFTGIHLDVQHIPDDKNIEADYLSRWKPPAPLAARWQPSFRRRFTLKQLWGG